MRVLYIEGLANHIGPELCVGVRKRDGEALTGGPAGWVLSREIHAPPRGGILRGADAGDPIGLCDRKICRACRAVERLKPTMNADGKSDRPVVPAKSPNKAEGTAAEAMEGRGRHVPPVAAQMRVAAAA
jgi:RNA-directed DNA polymerase